MLYRIAIVALASLSIQASVDLRTSFECKTYGFSVDYPSSWFLNTTTEGGFTIFNVPQSSRIRGAVLPANGAGIQVIVPEILAYRYRALPRTVEEWAAADAETGPEHVVFKQPLGASHAGRRLEGIEQRTVTGRGVDDLDSIDWYFVVEGRLFRASLFYRPGNTSSIKLMETLRETAFSVKLVKQQRALRKNS